jgi:nitrogenase molybdenum-iron protein beta chain
MCKAMVDYYAEPAEDKLRSVNILPGWVEPADMRYIKSLAATMGVDAIVFPDTSDVLDAPQTGRHDFYPSGGATVEQMRRSGASGHTLGLGLASKPAAEALDAKCKVPCSVLDLPIGLSATDRFVNKLRKVAGVEVPASVTAERGRLVDYITDMHQYLAGKRVALWGDPDQLVSLAEFLCDLDMKPVYIVTGTPGKIFKQRIDSVLDGRVPEAQIAFGQCADMLLLHQWIKNEPVDLLIGNTYGKYISRDEDIPLLRHGFPILDRQGHQHFPTVGYLGAIRLLEKMLTLFLDRKDRDAPEEAFELTL